MTNSYLAAARPARFSFRAEKAAEAIDFIARDYPGITQYFVGKLLYLADKAHFLDWGRPITFDRYVAMVHGPVPSAVRNMLAAAAGAEAGMDEARYAAARGDAEELSRRVRIELKLASNGERQYVYPLDDPQPYRHLSGSDIETLEATIRRYGGKTFGSLRDTTHKDDAWSTAWESRGASKVADIDIVNWARPEDRDEVRQQLLEYVSAAIG